MRRFSLAFGGDAVDTRLKQQLHFLLEVDKMKTVFRQTLLTDRSRRENDAEHSWHLALMAMMLQEYAAEPIDLFRVLKMALVHDLIEIYAGDTFAYDVEGNLSKQQREQQAADRLFALLPPDQGAEIRALWEEFDAMQTADARYAAAIDRIQPFLNNVVTDGHTWKQGRVHREQVLQRMDPVRLATPEIWPLIELAIADAVEKGQILP